jgi:hypothetical protein
MEPLTRTEFKERVFARDGGKCVLCGEPAVDAHHIIDRKCFPDGGYHLDNGAAVCSECHWKTERCEVSCEEVRKAAGIATVFLPPDWDPGLTYDKWGRPAACETLYKISHAETVSPV